MVSFDNSNVYYVEYIENACQVRRIDQKHENSKIYISNKNIIKIDVSTDNLIIFIESIGGITIETIHI